MNKIEKQIFDLVLPYLSDEEEAMEVAAKVASIALELADKAFVAGRSKSSYDQFKQEVL